MDKLDVFKNLLSKQGYSATKPRLATFKALLKESEPITTVELARRVIPVDRVTVYRTIQLFEELGIVHRVYVGWKYKLELSEEFIAHHHHLSCLSCGKIVDIEDEKHIDAFIEEISEKFGFKPEHHHFEVEGYCRTCQTSQLS